MSNTAEKLTDREKELLRVGLFYFRLYDDCCPDVGFGYNLSRFISRLPFKVDNQELMKVWDDVIQDKSKLT